MAIFQVVVAVVIEKFMVQSIGGTLMTGPNVAAPAARTLILYIVYLTSLPT
jgi:hypothetical protein